MINLHDKKNARIIKSQVFLGLWLAVEAMFLGEMREVLSILQLGLNQAGLNYSRQ